MFSTPLLSILGVLLLALAPESLSAQVTTLSPAEAEAQKCEDKIASVQRDILGKYDDQLGDLQLSMQKVADLEGALAVRTERQRVKMEQTLSERDYVNEPKALRAVQLQTVTKLRELTSQLVQDSVPRLIEFKKSLTMAGKLDEAVNVRVAIERLQNSYVPIIRADSTTPVPAETLILAYAGDRARADKTYKGQKIIVHGVLGGYRPDPVDAKNYQLFVTGGTGNGWVQCTMTFADFRFREDKNAFGAVTFVITSKDGENTARLQKGQTVDIRGICNGLDEVVRLDRCDMPK